MLNLDNNATFCYHKKQENESNHKVDKELDNYCKEYLEEEKKKEIIIKNKEYHKYSL